MPIRIYELVNTVEMLLYQLERRLKREKKKPKARSQRDQNYITKQNSFMMDRNHLTEEEAYRYITENAAMDSATSMVETAQMILTLIYDEV